MNRWISGRARYDVCSVTAPCTLCRQTFCDVPVNTNVGAAESINRLFRIADDEERARPHARHVIVL